MTFLNEAPEAALVFVALIGILLAAVLSAGEVAVISASRSSIAELVSSRPEKAKRIALLTENPTQVAAIAAFARVCAEMVATTCITVALTTVFTQWWVVVLVALAISALIALILVRFSPRTIGRYNPARVLGAVSGVLVVVYKALSWISPMTLAARVTPDREGENELREFVEHVEESGAIEDGEREMMRSIIELHDTKASEVMVPRTDMISIRGDVSLRKATSLFVRSGFSRVPVVGDSTDDIQGVLFFKDTARVLLNSVDPDSKIVADVMRPIRFYPEMKHADELLREMQASHQHIAMAVDEYGGVAGLVTIEDILEEIVGEMVDEHDVDAPGIESLGAGAFRVPARLSLDDLGSLFNLEIDDPDVDTVAGLLAKNLGKIPLAGASAEVSGLRISSDLFGGRRKQLSSVIVEKIPDIINDELGRANSDYQGPAGTSLSDQPHTGAAVKE